MKEDNMEIDMALKVLISILLLWSTLKRVYRGIKSDRAEKECGDSGGLEEIYQGGSHGATEHKETTK